MDTSAIDFFLNALIAAGVEEPARHYRCAIALAREIVPANAASLPQEAVQRACADLSPPERALLMLYFAQFAKKPTTVLVLAPASVDANTCASVVDYLRYRLPGEQVLLDYPDDDGRHSTTINQALRTVQGAQICLWLIDASFASDERCLAMLVAAFKRGTKVTGLRLPTQGAPEAFKNLRSTVQNSGPEALGKVVGNENLDRLESEFGFSSSDVHQALDAFLASYPASVNLDASNAVASKEDIFAATDLKRFLPDLSRSGPPMASQSSPSMSSAAAASLPKPGSPLKRPLLLIETKGQPAAAAAADVDHDDVGIEFEPAAKRTKSKTSPALAKPAARARRDKRAEISTLEKSYSDDEDAEVEVAVQDLCAAATKPKAEKHRSVKSAVKSAVARKEESAIPKRPSLPERPKRANQTIAQKDSTACESTTSLKMDAASAAVAAPPKPKPRPKPKPKLKNTATKKLRPDPSKWFNALQAAVAHSATPEEIGNALKELAHALCTGSTDRDEAAALAFLKDKGNVQSVLEDIVSLNAFPNQMPLVCGILEVLDALVVDSTRCVFSPADLVLSAVPATSFFLSEMPKSDDAAYGFVSPLLSLIGKTLQGAEKRFLEAGAYKLMVQIVSHNPKRKTFVFRKAVDLLSGLLRRDTRKDETLVADLVSEWPVMVSQARDYLASPRTIEVFFDAMHELLRKMLKLYEGGAPRSSGAWAVDLGPVCNSEACALLVDAIGSFPRDPGVVRSAIMCIRLLARDAECAEMMHNRSMGTLLLREILLLLTVDAEKSSSQTTTFLECGAECLSAFVCFANTCTENLGINVGHLALDSSGTVEIIVSAVYANEKDEHFLCAAVEVLAMFAKAASTSEPDKEKLIAAGVPVLCSEILRCRADAKELLRLFE